MRKQPYREGNTKWCTTFGKGSTIGILGFKMSPIFKAYLYTVEVWKTTQAVAYWLAQKPPTICLWAVRMQ